jgi:hypothetical protein
MASPFGNSSPHRWKQVKKLLLYPDILDLETYEAAVSTGILNSIAFLKEIDVLHNLGIEDLKHVHHLIFQQVHPWAGEFRTIGQMTTVAGFPSADPQRVVRELTMLLIQTSELIDEALAADDGLQWLAVLAFFHTRFERIHPFLDGTGRVILNAQFESIFDLPLSIADQSRYRTTLHAASAGNLAPLMNFFGASLNLYANVDSWVVPFRLAPRFLDQAEPEPSLLDDVHWSRIGR